MDEKWILIVDDEEPILSVLKGSLKRLGSQYKVATANSGYQAIEYLRQKPFDLVVTDYRMAGMDGLELLQTIRIMQPKARTILMTAYGSTHVEEETRRLNAFRYLSKPLEIDAFRKIVKEAFGDMPASRPGLIILSDEQYIEVNAILTQLRKDVGARCVILADSEGHFLTCIGDRECVPLEVVVPLLGGGVATLLEAGRVIDGEGDSINLAYREGAIEDLYAINVGRDLLLVVAIDHNTYSSRLGSVWYFAQQAVITLGEKFKGTLHAMPGKILDQGLEQTLDHELDQLLAGETTEADRGHFNRIIEGKD